MLLTRPRSLMPPPAPTVDIAGAPLPQPIRDMLRLLRVASPGFIERRTLPRHAYVAPSTFVHPDSSVTHFWSRDLSRYALGFLSIGPLKLALHGPVYFDLPDGTRAQTQAVVARCQPFAPNCFHGCIDFNMPLPEEIYQLATTPK